MNNPVFAAIQNRDAGALAQHLPAENRRVINPQAEKLVDILFLNLAQIFLAGRRSPEETGVMKQQWILAFAENGITTKAQIAAGMRIARQQPTDFWPSCGKFIAWCKEECSTVVGLPSIDDAMAEFERYCANRDRYESPESYPWSHPVLYWIVLDVRRAMYQYKHTAAETKKSIHTQLTRWTKKLASGEVVPTPTAQIENKTRAPSVAELIDKNGEYQQRGAELLAMIRAKQRSNL